jgi:spore maturation protein CgeB
MEFDYGLPKNGINFIGRAMQNAFKAAGHEVETLYFDAFLKQTQPVPELQELLLKRAEAERPGLIFFPMFTGQFAFETLDRLKQNFCTVAWFGDDTWRFDSYSKAYASHFTWCVTTDKFSIEKYHAAGQKNVVLSQWAAIDDDVPPVEFDGKYLYDVSFVGMFNHYRQWFVNRLKMGGIKVECFGKGWENGAIDDRRMNEVFMRSKINLNIANSICHDIRFLLSSPIVFARYLFSRKNMGQIKARNFEIPYYGGFQMTDFFPGIEDYFDIGREIVCFKDVDEAVVLIRYYLGRENSRRQMIDQAQKKARAGHGYINRVKEILEAVGRQ